MSIFCVPNCFFSGYHATFSERTAEVKGVYIMENANKNLKFVVKRDGSYRTFDVKKIKNAIEKAFVEVYGGEKAIEDFRNGTPLNEVVSSEMVRIIEGSVSDSLGALQKELLNVEADHISVEEIQDMVERAICSVDIGVGLSYAKYRGAHTYVRKNRDNLYAQIDAHRMSSDRSNANVLNGPMAKMLQIGGDATKAFALDNVIPNEFARAHRNGDLYIHDLDFYMLTINCLQIPVAKLFKEGFNAGHGYVRPPKRIESASALACIILQASQNDFFGGQSIPAFDTLLAPFCGPEVSDERVAQSMQGVIFNLNTMHSRAGSQVPFTSLNFGEDTSAGGRRVTKFLLEAYDAGLGNGENPIFPNLLYHVRKGVNRFPSDPNYDLFRLAMRVTAHRMNPTYVFMDSSFNSPYGSVDYMGCRTRVVSNVNGEEKSESRGNLFFNTLNLPRLAIEASMGLDKSKDKELIEKRFFDGLDNLIDMAERQLMNRYEYVRDNLKAKDMPFAMGQHLYMGSEGLSDEDSIEPAIKHGTLSMGFIGLAECLTALTGKHHGESEESNLLGHRIVSHMRQAMDKMTEKTHLNFSLFATPAEGLSGKFTEKDRKKYGVIPGVTDKEYYTNSVHVPVYCKINHYKKVEIEGAYHKYLNAGHICYVEFQSPLTNNLAALEKELNHMADSDVGYAGINFPIDYCDQCGYQGVIDTEECPVCGSVGHIHRIRRVTGYFSEIKNMNDSKRAEVRDRTATLKK